MCTIDLRFFLAIVLGLFAPLAARCQDAKPFVIQGELTEKDAFDTLRDTSRAKVHELELKAGEVYLFDLRSVDFDPFLRLEAAAGVKISENDDVSDTDLSSRIAFAPKKTGKYRAVVTAFEGGITGRYSLQLGKLKNVGNAKTIAGKLTADSPKGGLRYFAVHKFEFKAGDYWLIDLSSRDFDPGLTVVFNKKLVASDIGDNGPNARLVVAIAETGEHLLQAVALGAGAKGDYTLRLQRVERAQPIVLSQEEHWRQRAAELNQLGIGLKEQKKWKEAEEPLRESLQLRQKLYPKVLFPKGNPELAASHFHLAFVKNALGDYVAGESNYKQALEITRLVRGEQHAEVALILSRLAELYEWQGDFARAEPLLVQVLEIRRQTLGEQHADFATSLNALAVIHRQRGAYARAEPMFKQALEIRRKVLGEKHPEFTVSLNNLALLYQSQGAYAKAEPLYQQSLATRREVLGDNHSFISGSLNNLAWLYHEQGEFAKAEAHYKQAIDTARRVLGKGHPQVAWPLSNLGALYQRQAKYADAESLFREALEIRKTILREQHPDYAISLTHLGTLHALKKEYALAESLCKQALEIRRAMLGEKHPVFALSLNTLARVKFESGDARAAEMLGRQSVQIILEHLEATAAGQTEEAQAAFLRKQQFVLNAYLSYSGAAKPAAEDAYAVLLPWKGAITSRQRLTRFARTALGDADKETVELFARLDGVSRQYASLVNRPFDPRTAGSLPKRLRELGDEREKLEVELSGRTAEFRNLRQAKRLSPKDLQRALPEGSVLVDFLVYKKFEPKTTRVSENLVAFVVSNKNIERIEFGELGPLTAAIDSFLVTLKRGQPVAGAKDPAVFLRDHLWQKIARHVAGARTVLISPDGPLCRLPFAALPVTAAGKYLIEETPIAVIPVPQLLPEFLGKASVVEPASLLVMGDVYFDATLVASSKRQTPGELESILAEVKERSGTGLNWARLPGTLTEMESIEKLFRTRSPQGELAVLAREHATEAALRAKVARHSYLHLATHGFFAPPQIKTMRAGDKNEGPERDNQAVIGHLPSLLSGLVLAGANHPGAGDDDGILTALEVGELNLARVRLAVLSACETGLGETAGGEGVLGLQRAFQIAGAKSTITTLWSIPDEPTRILMERFYENHWSKKMGKLDALIEAQRWMLNEGKTNPGVQRGIQRLEKTTDPIAPGRLPPYYWAAFVLSGDWR